MNTKSHQDKGLPSNFNKNIKILLADDSLTMHRAVTLALGSEGGFELNAVDNGEDALHIARKVRPDVVLADVDMPGLTGPELCASIKSDPHLEHTRVILLCSSFDGYGEEELSRVKADGKIWKPFEAPALLKLIHQILAGESSQPKTNTSVFGREDLAKALTEETFATNPSTPPRELAARSEFSEEALEPSHSKDYQPSFSVDVSENPSEPALSMEPSVNSSIYVDTPSSPDTENLWGVSESTSFEVLGLSKGSEKFSDEGTFSIQTEAPAANTPETTDFSSESLTESLDEENSLSSKLPPVPKFAPLDETQQTEKLGSNQAATLALDAWSSDSDFSSFQSPEDPASEIPHLAADAGLLSSTPWQPDSDSPDFSSLGGSATNVTSPRSSEASFSEAEIRNMVREEIREAFSGWLKRQLEEELAKVLKEIDRA